MSNKPELNTDNPEYFTWQYEQLHIAILGGLKIEGLDRLRVTLKIPMEGAGHQAHLAVKLDSPVQLYKGRGGLQ